MRSITVKVKEKPTNKTVYQFQDEGIPLDFFIKKVGAQKNFFYLIHSGGESGGSTTLRYLTLNKGQILNKMVEESPASFEFVDVDKDGNAEIVTQDMRFEWFEVEKDCHIVSFYAEYFDSSEYFFPKIFTLENSEFVNNTFKFKKYLQHDYLANLEQMLLKDGEEKSYIAGFIQYFYVSAKLGRTKSALTFIKQHNKPFQRYRCQDGKTVNTTVFDFINKYQDNIRLFRE